MATHAGYAMRVVSRGLFPPLPRGELAVMSFDDAADVIKTKLHGFECHTAASEATSAELDQGQTIAFPALFSRRRACSTLAIQRVQ